jgi:hypothetical protein
LVCFDGWTMNLVFALISFCLFWQSPLPILRRTSTTGTWAFLVSMFELISHGHRLQRQNSQNGDSTPQRKINKAGLCSPSFANPPEKNSHAMSVYHQFETHHYAHSSQTLEMRTSKRRPDTQGMISSTVVPKTGFLHSKSIFLQVSALPSPLLCI